MSQLERGNRPSNVEYNPGIDTSRASVDILSLPEDLRDNEVMNNLVETVGLAGELEKSIIGLLSPTDPNTRLSRDIERLLETHKQTSGLDLRSTHGELFSNTMLNIRDFYQYAGVTPGADGTPQLTGVSHEDVQKLKDYVEGNFITNNNYSATAGAIAGGAAAYGAIGGAAAFTSTTAAAAVFTGLTVGTGGLALLAIGAGAATFAAIDEFWLEGERNELLARVQAHLDEVSGELDKNREGFKNLEFALNAISDATATPPTFRSSKSQEFNTRYAEQLTAANTALLNESKNGIPNIDNYLAKQEEIKAKFASADTAIAQIDATDPTTGGTISFTETLDLEAATITQTKSTDIEEIFTQATGTATTEALAQKITTKTEKWSEIPTRLNTLAGYSTQMSTRKSNLEATLVTDEQKALPANRSLLNFADQVIQRTHEDAATALIRKEFEIPETFEDYFAQFLGHPDLTAYPVSQPAPAEVAPEQPINS